MPHPLAKFRSNKNVYIIDLKECWYVEVKDKKSGIKVRGVGKTICRLSYFQNGRSFPKPGNNLACENSSIQYPRDIARDF